MVKLIIQTGNAFSNIELSNLKLLNEWNVPVSFIVISGKTYPDLLIQTSLFEMDIDEYGIKSYGL